MNDASLRQRALVLFEEIVDLPVDERSARLAALATGEPLLHADVAALLAADAVSGGLLERSPAGVFEGGDDAGDDDTPDPLLDQRVGPWRISGIVGRGGMGAVYRGERVEGAFQQQAAIKLIRLGMDRAEVRRRFLRERQILARLQHPNIATLLDGGVADNGAPYFAMELVDGVPIDRWCDAQRLDLRARIRLFVQVCSAVQHAHQNLAVHRDLKPNNILVTIDGQAKLLDFGIAKLLVDDTGQTQTRDHLLTPEYAAPEQLHGEAVSTVTDLYALGVVLYGLLAGAHPYALTSRTPLPRQLALMEREPEAITHAAARIDPIHAQTRRLNPRALAAALRGDLAAIVHRCLQAEPARRYPSVEALASDLKAWLDGRPVGARLGHRGYRLRKFASRHRWGVAAGAAALLAIGGASGVALVQAREARLQATLAQASAQRAEASAAHALDTRNFAVSLLASANPIQSAKGAQTSAVELLQAAATRVDTELVDAPVSQAELRATIGAGLYQMGDREGGRALLDRGLAQMDALGVHGLPRVDALQARAVAERETGDDDGAERDIRMALAELPRLAGDQRLRGIKLRTSLATIASQRGNLREALALNQANLRDRTALLGDGHEETAVDWNNLASTHLRLDQFRQAEAAFQRADDILARRKGPDFARRAWTQNGVASARSLQGDRIALTNDAFNEAERVMRKSLPPGHPIGVTLLGNRAGLLLRMGDMAKAEAAYVDALSHARAAKADTADVIEGLLGLTQLLLGRPAQAQAHLAPAVAAMVRDRAPSEPALNRMQSALGLARLQLGEREQGEREIRAALERLRAADFTATDDYADIASDLASALEATGRRDEARQWRERAHATFVQVNGADHPRTKRESRQLGAKG